jgi:hypothetical protein
MLGYGKGIPLSRFKEGAQDADKALRHPSKGTIGYQKGTFLGYRGILPVEVCPLTLITNKKGYERSEFS